MLSEFPANEYLLIVQPHEDLYNRIMAIKQSFAETYDCPAASYTKPHITLVKFTQYDMAEQRIIHKLQVLAAANAPFAVELNGFGSFPTHTVYLNIQSKNPILDLIKDLKQAQHLLKTDKEHKPHFMTEPHISIARKLLPWQFEKSWLEYSHTPFTGKFIASELLLLKKKGGTKAYHIAARLALQNQKVRTEQGSLFA
jgi:2'-5' RNA ligase